MSEEMNKKIAKYRNEDIKRRLRNSEATFGLGLLMYFFTIFMLPLLIVIFLKYWYIVLILFIFLLYSFFKWVISNKISSKELSLYFLVSGYYYLKEENLNPKLYKKCFKLFYINFRRFHGEHSGFGTDFSKEIGRVYKEISKKLNKIDIDNLRGIIIRLLRVIETEDFNDGYKYLKGKEFEYGQEKEGLFFKISEKLRIFYSFIKDEIIVPYWVYIIIVSIVAIVFSIFYWTILKYIEGMDTFLPILFSVIATTFLLCVFIQKRRKK